SSMPDSSCRSPRNQTRKANRRSIPLIPFPRTFPHQRPPHRAAISSVARPPPLGTGSAGSDPAAVAGSKPTSSQTRPCGSTEVDLDLRSSPGGDVDAPGDGVVAFLPDLDRIPAWLQLRQQQQHGVAVDVHLSLAGVVEIDLRAGGRSIAGVNEDLAG